MADHNQTRTIADAAGQTAEVQMTGVQLGDDPTAYTLVRLPNGELAAIADDQIELGEDGAAHVPYRWREASALGGQTVTIPVVSEEVEVGTQTVDTGTVRLRKVVRTEEETVDTITHREDIDVERVPIGKIVDEAPPAIRQEGDTVVVPLLEEVLVVEKRLLLREEVRLTRRRTARSRPRKVTVRKEDVVVERDDEKAAS